MKKTFTIQYDYRIDEVVDKISGLLKDFGIEIVSDNLPHDGFEIYELRHIWDTKENIDEVIQNNTNRINILKNNT